MAFIIFDKVDDLIWLRYDQDRNVIATHGISGRLAGDWNMRFIIIQPHFITEFHARNYYCRVLTILAKLFYENFSTKTICQIFGQVSNKTY